MRTNVIWAAAVSLLLVGTIVAQEPVEEGAPRTYRGYGTPAQESDRGSSNLSDGTSTQPRYGDTEDMSGWSYDGRDRRTDGAATIAASRQSAASDCYIAAARCVMVVRSRYGLTEGGEAGLGAGEHVALGFSFGAGAMYMRNGNRPEESPNGGW